MLEQATHYVAGVLREIRIIFSKKKKKKGLGKWVCSLLLNFGYYFEWIHHSKQIKIIFYFSSFMFFKNLEKHFHLKFLIMNFLLVTTIKIFFNVPSMTKERELYFISSLVWKIFSKIIFHQTYFSTTYSKNIYIFLRFS